MTVKIESRALIYLPAGPGPHPVLCFLHGIGEGAAGKEGQPQPLDKVLEHQSPPWHVQNGSPFIARFLVVCPQLGSRRRWERDDAAWIERIVEALPIDRARLTLTGFSFGGEGIFQIAGRSRLPWRTLWAVDPALQRLPPAPGPETRVWIHHGDEQPGSDNRAGFAQTLGLEAFRPDARRILVAVKKNHPETCTAGYADQRAYQWLG